jgi:signal peptidase II
MEATTAVLDPSRRRRIILITSMCVLVVDQITKMLCWMNIPLHARVPVIGNVLSLTHVHNRGMAFGFFNTGQADWVRWALVAVAIAAVAIIWSYARHESAQRSVVLAFGAILGGAVGNLVDRLIHGYVIDFVLLHWNRHEFPAFNVADSAITMGGIALFLALARNNAEPAEPEHSPGDVRTLADQPASDDA